MFQLKENFEDIIKFILNSKDISKRDVVVLNKLASKFSKIPETYPFYYAAKASEIYKASKSFYVPLIIINLFIYMSYVFNIQPTDLIKLWIDNHILFLPGTASSRGISLEKTTKLFMLKHRYNIKYVVADDIKNNSLKFISDKEEIENILSPYTIISEEGFVVKYADNKPYTVEMSSVNIANNLKILHNTKKVIKGLLGITNKQYKKLTNHFIEKSDYSINPIPVQYDLYYLYASTIKDLSKKYNIEVNEYLIIHIVLEKTGILLRTDIFEYQLKKVFEKLRDEVM